MVGEELKRRSAEGTPYVIAHPSLFTALELDLYEKEILSNPKATERDASDFFDRIPKFICVGVGTEIRREVVLSAKDGIYRVDFFRRSFGKKFWDIVELKSPQTPFIVGVSSEHPHFSAELRAAIDQAEDYRQRLDEDSELRAELQKRGISVRRPRIMVVAGRRNSEVSAETLQILEDRVRRSGTIDVWSYLDIWEFAKEHYAANKVVVCLGELGITREAASGRILWQGGPKLWFPADCADCGKGIFLPFEPRGGRPVYCRECWVRRRDQRLGRPRPSTESCSIGLCSGAPDGP